MSQAGARVLLITYPVDGAEAFARSLVERRLAACVNLVAARSVFRWDGAVTSDAEALLIVKTRAAHVAAVEAVLEAEHPYDVPELVALDPAHVEPAYLAWIEAETEAPA